MKQIFVLMLILLLVLTACTQANKQANNVEVTDTNSNSGNVKVDVVDNVVDSNVENTQSNIVQDVTTNEDDSVLYKGVFESNHQLLIGSYKIYYYHGDSILEFSDDFEVGKNKDINVYVSAIGRPSEAEFVWRSDYEIVGDLVKPKGFQKYVIPDTIDLSKYKSVVLLDTSTGIVHGSARLTK